ncbi:uncharacterized protein BKA78DRAFT_299765 [Phyllosticta capitalensis]|uniref:Uncharacterized protein n=1 Tax=Phyllosticta capitalensis TaxID=121624 RepID=A0ABR1YCQ6_9PEZI
MAPSSPDNDQEAATSLQQEFPDRRPWKKRPMHPRPAARRLTRAPSSDVQSSAHSPDGSAVRESEQYQPTSTNEMSSPLSPRQDTLAPPAVAQQQHAFEACLRQVNVQSRELITAISNLEIILNAALDAAVTDTDLASIGFEPHDLPDGFRVYFRNVDQRGQGSGAEQSFGGPFLREEAVAEFRAEMARRQS